MSESDAYYLAGGIEAMLTHGAREELKAELRSLEEMRQKLNETINAKVEAIKAILDPGPNFGFFEGDGTPKVVKTVKVDPGTNGRIAIPPGWVHINGRPLTGMGLRPAIKAILAETEKGLRPAEIADALEEGGYTPGGKTSTKRLVYGEVHRLKKMGVLNAIGRGKYRLAAI